MIKKRIFYFLNFLLEDPIALLRNVERTYMQGSRTYTNIETFFFKCTETCFAKLLILYVQ